MKDDRLLHVGSLVEMIREVQKNHSSYGACSWSLFKWVDNHAKDPKGSQISLSDFIKEIHELQKEPQ